MKLNLTLDTWIVSDTHFNHDNIVRYCGRPVDHTEIMVKNWHKLVRPDDTVLHLGDIFMGRTSASANILRNLPGNKFFIRGNHDKKGLHWYMDVGFVHAGGVEDNGTRILNAVLFREPQGKRVLFTHYPDLQYLDKWDINVHGHIHNNGHAVGVPIRDYRNMSVEVVGYRPHRLRDILYGTSYQSRVKAGTWGGQTRREGEHKDSSQPTPKRVRNNYRLARSK